MATIKAGTYVFKETPVAASPSVSTAIEYKTYVLTANNTYSNTLQPWHYINSGYTFNGSSQVYCVEMSNSTGGTDFNNKYYAENVGWVQWYWADGEYTPKYTATDTTKLRTIIVETDQTVSDEFYTWFDANMEKTLHDQAEQCITDAYTAIGNKSGTIPTQKNLQNLAGAIDTISTGTDTSDGNIEPTTVLKGYKGYAKGVKVTGAIETYDGTVEDVVKLIKAGTYMWVDNPDISMFSPEAGNYVSTNINFTSDGLSFTKIYTMTLASTASCGVGYIPQPQYVYNLGWSGNNRWGYYDEDLSWVENMAYKTITIATDQQVDTDFYEWAITGGNLIKQ